MPITFIPFGKVDYNNIFSPGETCAPFNMIPSPSGWQLFDPFYIENQYSFIPSLDTKAAISVRYSDGTIVKYIAVGGVPPKIYAIDGVAPPGYVDHTGSITISMDYSNHFFRQYGDNIIFSDAVNSIWALIGKNFYHPSDVFEKLMQTTSPTTADFTAKCGCVWKNRMYWGNIKMLDNWPSTSPVFTSGETYTDLVWWSGTDNVRRYGDADNSPTILGTGWARLLDGYGEIMDIASTQDAVYVLKRRAIYMQDVPSGPFRLIATDIGPISRRCAVSFGGKVYFITNSGKIAEISGNSVNIVSDALYSAVTADNSLVADFRYGMQIPYKYEGSTHGKKLLLAGVGAPIAISSLGVAWPIFMYFTYDAIFDESILTSKPYDGSYNFLLFYDTTLEQPFLFFLREGKFLFCLSNDIERAVDVTIYSKIDAGNLVSLPLFARSIYTTIPVSISARMFTSIFLPGAITRVTRVLPAWFGVGVSGLSDVEARVYSMVSPGKWDFVDSNQPSQDGWITFSNSYNGMGHIIRLNMKMQGSTSSAGFFSAGAGSIGLGGLYVQYATIGAFK